MKDLELQDICNIIKMIFLFIVKTISMCCMFLLCAMTTIFFYNLFHSNDPITLPNAISHDMDASNMFMVIIMVICKFLMFLWIPTIVFKTFSKIFCMRITICDFVYIGIIPLFLYCNKNPIIADYCILSLIIVLFFKNFVQRMILNYSNTPPTVINYNKEPNVYVIEKHIPQQTQTQVIEKQIEQPKPVRSILVAYQLNPKTVMVQTSDKNNWTLNGTLLSFSPNSITVKPFENSKMAIVYDSEKNTIANILVM